MCLRVPLIPGVTDDGANFVAIARLARAHGLTTVSLAPYHALGRDKYLEVGRPAAPDVRPLLPATLDAALTLFASQGLTADVA